MAAVAFNWSEYFRLAQELAARTGDEASQRNAISRAYYFVYHLALQRAMRTNFSLKFDEGTHVQLWSLFSGNPEPECRRLGELGNRMREKRVRADYRDHYVRVEDDVPFVLADAQDFVVRLNRLDPRHPSPQSTRR
jgi:uncharacterized protein (UPF0332 family)